MNTIYESEIKDDYKELKALNLMFSERFKDRVPVPYDLNRKYLICHEDGLIIGFADSEDNSKKLARQWVWDNGEGHVKNGSTVSLRKTHHHYYVINLYPGANWSKKYRAFDEELTPVGEYAGVSAEIFYNKDYFSDFEKEKVNSYINDQNNNILRRNEEESEVFTTLFWVVIILLWIFGGFAWLEP